MIEVVDNREQEYLLACRRGIEQKLQWGPSGGWNSQEFEELSELINKETGVVLSKTTLKRIWGRVQYQNSPTLTTLNALAGFIGFSNWREFKLATPLLQSPDITPSQGKPAVKVKKYSWILVSLIILIGAFFLINNSLKTGQVISKEVLNKIRFTSQPVTTGLPNSVVFDFDLPMIESENVRIQQYWDETKTIGINTAQHTATGIYYFPGYFRAKLIVDDQVVKEHDLFIKSGGWMATLDIADIPRYLKEDELYNATSLGVSESIISEVADMEEAKFLTYHLVQPFGNISGDNFTLNTKLRNTYSAGSAVCQTTKIYILGSKGAMVVPFSIPGCVSDINLMLNDHYLSGKSNDLSALGADFKTWQDVKVKVDDKSVKIFINHELRLEDSYHQTMGKVVGLRYKFLGAGEVMDVNLSDEKGENIYQFGTEE